jgi:FAD-dependent oxidoreductase domain-containing protein 1
VSRAVDVLIVGGGVVGSAIAYFLKSALGFPGSVLVVEKDPTYANGSTGRSAGGIRQQFSIAENVRMSMFGMEFLRRVPELLAVDGEAPALSFREEGDLVLATEEGLSVLAENHRIQRSCGAEVALLDAPALRRRFPWLATDGIAGGSVGLANEGWFDPHGLLQAFRKKARAAGAVFEEDTVVALSRDGNRVLGAGLAEAGDVAAGVVVNAAGPSAGAVAAMLGIALPVGPRKRSVFVVHCRERVAPCPLTIDTSGVWFRPEGDGFICGVSPEEENDPETWSFDIDYPIYEEVVWPALARRVPAFEALKQVSAWTGHYDYNALDQNAILGPHPEVANFYFANGFSGHGLQQSPATGRAVAEHIMFGGYRSLDLSVFSYERIAAKRPYRERNIV